MPYLVPEELLGGVAIMDGALEVVLPVLVLPEALPIIPLRRLAPPHPHVVHVEDLRASKGALGSLGFGPISFPQFDGPIPLPTSP